MTPPCLRSVMASPLDITQPLATCVIGTRLCTLTSGLSAQSREGTTQMPSERCADSSDSRLVARAFTTSTTVTSEAGVDFDDDTPTIRLAIRARVPSELTATAYGSRPAATRLISCNGEADRTE